MTERHTHVHRYEDGPYDARDDPGSHTATNLRAALNQPSASTLTARLRVPQRFCWCGEQHAKGWAGDHPWPSMDFMVDSDE